MKRAAATAACALLAVAFVASPILEPAVERLVWWAICGGITGWFLASYHKVTDGAWKESRIGRNVMTLGAVIFGVSVYILIAAFLPLWLRELVSPLIPMTVAFVIYWRRRIVVAAYKEEAQRATE